MSECRGFLQSLSYSILGAPTPASPTPYRQPGGARRLTVFPTFRAQLVAEADGSNAGV
jgi:hypothetical protein